MVRSVCLSKRARARQRQRLNTGFGTPFVPRLLLRSSAASIRSGWSQDQRCSTWALLRGLLSRTCPTWWARLVSYTLWSSRTARDAISSMWRRSAPILSRSSRTRVTRPNTGCSSAWSTASSPTSLSPTRLVSSLSTRTCSSRTRATRSSQSRRTASTRLRQLSTSSRRRSRSSPKRSSSRSSSSLSNHTSVTTQLSSHAIGRRAGRAPRSRKRAEGSCSCLSAMAFAPPHENRGSSQHGRFGRLLIVRCRHPRTDVALISLKLFAHVGIFHSCVEQRRGGYVQSVLALDRDVLSVAASTVCPWCDVAGCTEEYPE
mmetsp:Transcript_44173/g.94051  ORF Transcript_44173/g.94051 Transcript_44173/m.94051 type:complete len:316 (+) Transcript_44173:212-1159(+)